MITVTFCACFWDWIFGGLGQVLLFPGQCGWFKDCLLSPWLFLGHPLWLMVTQGIYQKKSQLQVHLQLVYLKTSLVYNGKSMESFVRLANDDDVLAKPIAACNF